MDSSAKNIVTVEDPVEYRLESISQTQVHEEIGYTFASAIRSFLRQDPNIILVGEIRDEETAQAAVRAAMTGHLVLSTLHTNDAAGAVERLIDMGVAPYLVASTVRLALAQRLLRCLCSACGGSTGNKCASCGSSGFRGRIGVFEVLPFDSDVTRMIATQCTTDELRVHGRKRGAISLRQAGQKLVDERITTSEELERETSL